MRRLNLITIAALLLIVNETNANVADFTNHPHHAASKMIMNKDTKELEHPEPGGYYCGLKTVGFESLGLSLSAQVVMFMNRKAKTFSFKVNGDMHVSACQNIDYHWDNNTGIGIPVENVDYGYPDCYTEVLSRYYSSMKISFKWDKSSNTVTFLLSDVPMVSTVEVVLQQRQDGCYCNDEQHHHYCNAPYSISGSDIADTLPIHSFWEKTTFKDKK